ncbi:MAG: hypothetical protein Q9O62_01480 [Ardenticatenia bacterium]|nr:hypothetical protein [Ardenticatenia bacterium]
MRDLARPGKAEVIVIGEGVAALLVAHRLGLAGRRTVLVLEAPFRPPPGPAEWMTVPLIGGAERQALAQSGWEHLEHHGNALPGLRFGEAEWVAEESAPRRVPALWYDAARLLPALADRAGEAGVKVVCTRVRGISVIEGRVLGVVTEARRWDARRLVIAAEQRERAHALTRMAQVPQQIPETTWPLRRLHHGESSARSGPTGLLWPAEGGLWLWGTVPNIEQSGPCLANVPLSPPEHSPAVGPAPRVHGLWWALGMAGWPLVAAGAALRLARELLDT